MSLFNICTYNVRSSSDINEHALDTMLSESKFFKWDVIGLCETKIKEAEISETVEGHLLFTAGNGVTRRNGVGFLVHQSIIRYIESFENYSDRLCKITLKLKECKIVLVQVYMPTSTSSDQDVEKIYH